MKRMLYLAAAASCLLLASCRADGSTAPVSSESSETLPETTVTDMTTVPSETETTGTEFPRYTSYEDDHYFYEINCPVVPAKEALTITQIDFPSEIDGKEVRVDGFSDEETLIVQLYRESGQSAEIGMISLKDGKAGEYQRLLELSQGQSASYLSERWLFISEPGVETDFFANSTPICYELYDLQQKKLLEPFYIATVISSEVPPYIRRFRNAPLLNGGILYFDDVIWEDGEWKATLYGYDIACGKITETYPECQQQMLYQGQLIGRTKNDAGYDQRLISLKDNGASFQKDCSGLTNAAAGPDTLFAFTDAGHEPLFDDDPESGYLVISKLLDLTSGQELFTSSGLVYGYSDITVSDRLAGWESGYPMRPALYDIREQRLISFDKEVRTIDDPSWFGDEKYYDSYKEYVKGNTALILLRNPLYSYQKALLVKIP